SSGATLSRRAAGKSSGYRSRRVTPPPPSSRRSAARAVEPRPFRPNAPNPPTPRHLIIWIGLTTSNSLNLRALLQTAVARSGMDRPATVVSGLTPPAKALYVAAASQSMPRGTVVFVVPTDRDVEEAVADVAFFVAALEGFSAAASEQAVLPFPS